MDNQHIQQVAHNPIEPIRLERGEGDTVIIDDMVFHADFFRTFKSELSAKVLYRIDKDGGYHIVRTLHEAAEFFAPELLVNAK